MQSDVLEMSVLWDGSLLDVQHLDSTAVPRWPDGRELNNGVGVDVAAGEVRRIRNGRITVELRRVARSAPVQRRRAVSDAVFLQLLLGIAAVHVLMLFIAQAAPAGGPLDDALARNQETFRRVIMSPPPKPTRTAVAASGEAGRVGRQDAPLPKARASGGARRKATREEQLKLVRSKGVLSVLGSGAVARVLGSGLGDGLEESLGHLQNGVVGSASGAEGMATRGNGPGGGGEVAVIGVIGGSRHGEPGRFDVDLSARKMRVKVDGRCNGCRVEGALDREEVARVIRRYLTQIRYCYEKELNRSPNLAGKVNVTFLISGVGRVESADVVESTLADGTVESCVTGVIRRMVFPAPRGGGVVEVNHPFFFQHAGE